MVRIQAVDNAKMSSLSPVLGLLIYNTESHKLFLGDGTELKELLSLNVEDRSEIEAILNTTPGEIGPGKALIADSNNSISGLTSIATDKLIINGVEFTVNGGIITGSGSSESPYTTNITPGTGAANKALVLDTSRNITNINSLSATSLTGTLTTGSQHNISSLSDIIIEQNVDIVDHNGSDTGLKLNGELIYATANQINKLSELDPGTASANKILITDINNNINNLNSLSASKLTGTLQTASQPNLTSLGTLSSLTVSGNIAGILSTSSQPNITSLGTLSGLTVSGNIAGTLSTSSQPNITSLGTLTSLVSNGNVDIAAHNGSTIGLKLGGVLITANSSEINKLTGITPGNTLANKVLIVDSNKDLNGLNSFSATSLTGTLETNSQPNITTLGILTGLSLNNNLNIIDHNSINKGLKLGGTLVLSTANELNYLSGLTIGTASADKALILDSNKDISGINILSATNLTGTLTTATQPNITSLGTLSTLTVGTITSATTSINIGNNKNIILNGTITGASTISATNLTGTLNTSSQPNITTLGSLTSLTTANLTLGSTLITTTGAELNILSGVTTTSSEINKLSSITNGTITASKVVIVDSNKDITGFRNISLTGTIIGASTLSATNLTGTLTTNAQPNITSLGSLTSLTTVSLTLGSTLITTTGTEINTLSGVTNGTITASKVVIVDSNKDITGFRNISLIGTLSGASTVSATNLTGTLTTSSQSNITTLGTLTSLTSNGNVNIASHNGTTTGLQLNGTLITATAANINLLSGLTAGTAIANKLLLIDSNKDINGLNSLSATNLTGTLTTNSQPNITSIGSLSSLTTSSLTLGLTLITSTGTEINTLTGVTAGTVSSSKTVIVDSNKDIIGFRNISLSGNLTGATTISASNLTGTLTTNAQPNITTLGTLTSLTLSGAISGITNISLNGTISGATTISATNLTGTLTTASQPNITSLGSLTSLTVDTLNCSSTSITITNNKNIILSGTSTITGATTISATNLTGTLTTASQPNITSLGSLTSLTTDTLTLGATTIIATGTEINTLTGVTAGTVSANKTIIVDSNKDISGFRNISLTGTLTGTIFTASQPNITSLGSLSSLTVDTLNCSSTSITITNNKNIILSGTSTITGATTISATNLTGTLTTNAQPNITSIGSLSSLTTASLILGATTITTTGAEINTLSGLTAGTVTASKLVVVDANKDISGFRNISLTGTLTGATTISSTNLTGTLTTNAQPNITSIGSLSSLTMTGAISGITNLNTTGINIFSNITDSSSNTTGSLIISGGIGIAKSVYIGGTLNLSKISGLSLPSNSTEAANKAYVDSFAQGLVIHAAVAASTTDPGVLTTDFSDGLTLDDYNLVVGDRILIKDQTNLVENGIYVVNLSGSPTRASDMPNGYDATGSSVFTINGSVNGSVNWVVITTIGTPNIVGTNNIIFTQFSAITNAGLGLQKNGTVFDVNVDNNSIEIYNNKLRLSSTNIGTGLTGGSGNILQVIPSQTQITSIGTLTTGTWNATAIGTQYGGTGLTNITAGYILYGNGTSALLSNSGFKFLSNILTVPTINLTSNITSTSTTTGSLVITGGIGISNNAYIGGTLSAGTSTLGALTGTSASLSSTLNVSGQTTLSTLSTGALTGTSATYSTTLGVTGTSTLGTLNAGTTNLTGSLSGVSANFSTTLGVTGISTLGVLNAGTTTLTGGLSGTSASFSTTLGVAGNSTLTTLTATNITCANITTSGIINNSNITSSTSTTTGSVILSGGLGMAGSINIGGNLTAGASTLGALTGTSITLSSTLNVTGNTTLGILNAGTTTLTGTLTGTNSTFSGNLNISGSTTLNTLTTNAITGTSANFSTTLGVTGTTTLGTLNAGLTTLSNSLSGTAASFSSTLGVTGTTTLGTLNAGITSLTGSLSGTNGTFSGNLSITGTSTLGNINSSGVFTNTNSTQSSSITTGAIIISGGVGISGKVYIGNNLNVSATSTFTGISVTTLNASSNTSLSVLSAGATTLTGSLTGTSASLSSTLNVSGNTILNNLNAGTTTLSALTGTSANFSSTLVVSGNTTLNNINANSLTLTGTLSTVNEIITNSLTVNNIDCTTFNTSGVVNINDTTESISASTGAIVIDGGLGIAKSVNIGGTLNAWNGISVNNTLITNLANPINDSDAATKDYVDTVAIQGLHVLDSVNVATTVSGTLSSSFANGSVIDGITLVTGNRILIKNQTNGIENGIYIVTSGTPTRSNDFPIGLSSSQNVVLILSGNSNAASSWIVNNTSGSDVVGTDILNYAQFSSSIDYKPGTGLTKSNNYFDVQVDGTSCEINNNKIRVASGLAGTGLIGGSGSALSVKPIQTQITSIGTIITGTWNATTIGVPYGGTGLTNITSGNILFGNGTSAIATNSSLTYLSSKLSTPTMQITSSIDNALVVNGGTTILGNFSVSGSTTIAAVNVTSEIISSTLDVTGLTTGTSANYSNNLSVDGSTTLHTITGTTLTLSSTLGVTGISTLGVLNASNTTLGTLGAQATTVTTLNAGATTLTGSLTGTSATLSSTLGITGLLTATSANFSSNVTIAGTLGLQAITGTTLSLSSTLGVTGISTLGVLNAGNTIVGTLGAQATTVTTLNAGATTLTGSLTGTSATLSSTLGVTGATTLTSASLSSTLGIAGITSITNNTTSNSTSTGALVITGGLGIGNNLYVGGLLSVTGITNHTGTVTVPTPVNPTDASTKSYVDSLITVAGTGLTKTTNTFSVNAAQTQITSLGTLTSLTTSGIFINSNTTDTTALGTGSCILSGGLSIAKQLWLGNNLNLTNNTSNTPFINLTNTVGGSANTTGITFSPSGTNRSTGIGAKIIAIDDTAYGSYLSLWGSTGNTTAVEQLRINGTTTSILGLVTQSNTTDSTSISTGAMILSGGLAVTKNITANSLNIQNIKLLQYGSSGWIDMPITTSSGIGSGGIGSNVWMGYASVSGDWFTNSVAGDICFRNTTGKLLFGDATGNASVIINNNLVGINTTTPARELDVVGSVSISGGQRCKRTIVTATTYTILVTDYFISCNSTSNNIVLTLPAAASNGGLLFIISKNSTDYNTITINPQAGETIANVSSITLQVPYSNITIISTNSTSWDIANYIPKTATSPSIYGLFPSGAGVDGTVTISTNTNLTRNMYYANLTVNSGITLNAAGWRILVTGNLVLNGKIANNGVNASGVTAGTAPAIGSTYLGNGTAGGAGKTATGAGSTGVNCTYSSFGGLGGNGSSAGGAAGTLVTPVEALGGKYIFTNLPDAWTNRMNPGAASASYVQAGSGGGGGRITATGSTTTRASGAGGSGAGFLVIAANNITGSGQFTAIGGNGSNATYTGTLGSATISGGGSGGGGCIVLIYQLMANTITTSVIGGTPGTGLGTGLAGSVGSPGQVFTIQL